MLNRLATDELTQQYNIPELPAYLERVDQLLIDSVSSAAPTIKRSAMQLIQGGGKRLRPALAIAAASSQGGEVDENVLKACAAIELVHLSTLVHDDIMDNADVRWGAPTINTTEGIGHAIVVGDYLLSLSAYMAASINSGVASTIAAATMEVCDGQSQETADIRNVDRSIDAYMDSIRKKTASLFAASCKVGALCAGLPKGHIDALTKFGESFGIAYQLTDDLLDFLSTAEAMGKPVGNDVKEGNYTLPILLAFQKPTGDKVRGLLKKGSVDQEKLVAALKSEGVFDETIQEIKKYNAHAAESLKILPKTNAVAGLSEFPSAYLDSILDSKVERLS
jgi:geranylgeranyl pyrophosphate synthase